MSDRQQTTVRSQLIQVGNSVLDALRVAYKEEGRKQLPNGILSFIEMADGFRRSSDFQSAIDCCEECLESIDTARFGDSSDVNTSRKYVKGLVWMQLGTVYLAQGRDWFERALHLYSESGNAFREFNKPYCEMIAYLAQARVFLLRQEFCNALRRYQEGLEASGSSHPRTDAMSRLKRRMEEEREIAEQECQKEIARGQRSKSLKSGPKEVVNDRSLQNQWPVQYGDTSDVTHSPTTLDADLPAHGSPDPSISVVARTESVDSFFGVYWSQFVNVADALVILDPASKDVMGSLEKELSKAVSLLSQGVSGSEWDLVIDSLGEFCDYSEKESAQENKSSVRELRRLVGELIASILAAFPIDDGLDSIRGELEGCLKRQQKRA
jgi:tetratricopeptide (TPR) repeat protein